MELIITTDKKGMAKLTALIRANHQQIKYQGSESNGSWNIRLTCSTEELFKLVHSCGRIGINLTFKTFKQVDQTSSAHCLEIS
jgi:hypothetical protein